MKHESLLLLTALLGLLVIGCQAEQPPSVTSTRDPNTKDPKQVALAARDALFQRLSTRLMEVIGESGPAAAIEVCSREAATLAAAVSRESDVMIGRTSFKLRNPKNSPPTWAKPLIEKKSEQPQYVELPNGDTGALLPIKLKKQCLVCHGPADQIAEDVRAKLADLYPEDRATGFQEGDLRGWFWVVVSAETTASTEDAEPPSSNRDKVFAQFDEVYIPALALTKQEKAVPSMAALKRLSQRWQETRSNIQQAIATDAQWPQDVAAIDAAILKSQDLAQANQLLEAHEALEVIRDLMMDARHRQRIPYALDSLSDYHITMEEIVKPAMKFTPENLTDLDIGRLQKLCEIADQKWQVVESTAFDLNVFGIEEAAAGKLSQFIEGERRAIGILQDALAGQDKPALLQAARGLKPPFAKVYMFFGDFESQP